MPSSHFSCVTLCASDQLVVYWYLRTGSPFSVPKRMVDRQICLLRFIADLRVVALSFVDVLSLPAPLARNLLLQRRLL